MSTLFFDNRRLLILLLLLVIVGGSAALVSMPNEEDPRITNRVATIFTPFPGASAQRVEQLVTEKIESTLKELEEVDELRSVSTNGLSSVTVVLNDEITDTDGPFGLVRDAVDDVRPRLPQGALDPIFDDSRGAAYTVLAALTWDASSEPNLIVMRRSALELQDRLRALPGTELVTLHGASSEEIIVATDAATTTALGLTKEQIAEAIRQADAKVSAGQFNGDSFEFNLEVRGEIDSLTRLRDVVIANDPSGAIVRVGDVAQLSRGLVLPATDLAYHNGEPAIIVATRMQRDLRVAEWSTRVQEEIDAFKFDLSGGVSVDVIFDQGAYASDRFATLITNLLIGAGLVVAVLFVTLGWRSALIVSSAIPLTGLASLIGLNFLGVSINQISITGLVVALGLLVDAAIVMTDAVRRQLIGGLTARDAVKASVQRLWIPLLSSTLTTVLAFLPLALLPGGTGEFVGGIGKSVIVALSMSFFLAMTAIAALAGIFLPRIIATERTTKNRPFWVSGIEIPPLAFVFRKLLRGSVSAPLTSILCACVLPILGFVGVGTLPTSFFPEADRNQFHVELRLPTQSSIGETIAAVKRAEQLMAERPDIEDFSWFVGRSAPSFYYNLAMNQDGNSNYAQAMVTTTQLRGLKDSINSIGVELSAALPNAQVISRQLIQGPPTFAPIELRIYGRDLGVLQEISEQARLVLSAIPEVTATNPSFAGGEPKLWLYIDQDRARQAGYTLTGIADVMRTELDGVTGGTIIEGTEELDIRVWTDARQRRVIEELASVDLLTPNAQSASVPVLALGELSLEPAPATLRRFQGNRVNIVSGYVAAGELPATAIEKFRTAWEKSGNQLPPGYRFEFGGDEEARADNIGALISQLGLIVVLMLATIVLTFNSFRLAGVVFVVAFLAIGLGMLSLSIFQFPFGFQPIIALVGLVGVAINAAIIILSGLRRNPAAAAGDRDAIVNEVLAASRHIWSTTITTFGGFLPLILSEGGFWPPFATAIAGGVLMSTIVSFFFVPQAFLLIRPKPSRSVGRDEALTANPA